MLGSSQSFKFIKQNLEKKLLLFCCSFLLTCQTKVALKSNVKNETQEMLSYVKPFRNVLQIPTLAHWQVSATAAAVPLPQDLSSVGN